MKYRLKQISLLVLSLSVLSYAQPLLILMSDDAAIVSRNVFETAISGGERNNYDGVVGIQFTTEKELTINKLGRNVSTSIAGSHKIQLWRVSDQVKIAEVTITSSSPVDELGYAYESLSSPVVLSGGADYRIGSNETNGGDLWAETIISTDNYYEDEISAIQQVYGSTDSYPTSLGTPGALYVPPTIYVIQ